MSDSSNPFIEMKDELSVARDDDTRYLGKSMFWKYFDRIPPKHLYRPSTVEYRSVKLMVVESLTILLILLLISVQVIFSFDGRWDAVSIDQRQYWSSGLESRITNTSTVYDWLLSDLISRVYSQDTDYGDPTAMTTPPDGWLLMDSATSYASVKSQGMFDISSTSPGWEGHYTGGVPFVSNVLLGSVRVRQVSVVPEVGCGFSASCYPDYSPAREEREKPIPSGISQSARSAYTWRPANYTLQPELRGHLNTYPGSGYVFDFPMNRTAALSTLSDLQTYGWMDNSTRVLVVESTVINSRVDAVINTVILIEFSRDSEISYEIISTPIPLPSRSVNMAMIMTILVFGYFTCYSLYILFLLTKTGPVDFFTYFWNIYDVITISLFFYGISLIITPFVGPTVLSPMFGSLQAWFMPVSRYVALVSELRTVMGVTSVMVWLRLVKCLILLGSARPMVVVMQRTITGFGKLGGWFVFTFVGFILGFYFALNPGGSFSATVFTSVYMLARGVSLGNEYDALVVLLYIGFLLVFMVLVPSVLVGTVLYNIRAYDAELKAAIKTIERDKTALFPPGIDRTSFWHNDLFRVFWFSWIYKVLGKDLIEELEEDVGAPDEQEIDLDLLPMVVQDKWRSKKEELWDFVDKSRRQGKMIKAISRYGGLVKSSIFGKSTVPKSMEHIQTMSGGFAKSSVAKNDSIITRIQLQRLLDSDEDLVRALLTTEKVSRGKRTTDDSSAPSLRIKAVELIRKYGTKQAITRKHIFENLLGNVSLAMIGAENIPRGLTGTILEVNESWKNKLEQLNSAVAVIEEDLARIE
jgi:hypothetical protein